MSKNEQTKAGQLADSLLIQQVSLLIQQARQHLQRSVNTAMVHTYWQIGRLIVEDELQGENRAAYGKAVLENLSQRLTQQFGKGFDVTNLCNMRRFYEAFPIRDAVRLELSWTHYNLLAPQENSAARNWYMHEVEMAKYLEELGYGA